MPRKPTEGTNTELDQLLQGMHARERRALAQRLVREYAPEEAEREYGGEQTQRARILAVIRAYPRPSYRALADLAFDDVGLESRVKLGGHLWKMEEAGLLRNLGRGLWEAVKTPSETPTKEIAPAKKRKTAKKP